MAGENYFHIVDWIVLLVTLIISLFIGIYFHFTNRSTDQLLVGGRNMSILPVAASLMVSYFSAIAILGYPSEIFLHGTQIFMLSIVAGFAIILASFVFVPFFYKMKLTSIYEYLEIRFESRLVRKLAAGIFIIQQLSISGIVLYAPSLALEAFLSFPTWASIVLIGVCGTLYTSFGGLKAVIWTDVFQFFMIIIGMSAILIRGFYSAGGVSNALNFANEHGRIQFLDLSVDPFQRHNTLNFILGTGLLVFLGAGTHQIQVQRYSSLPSPKAAIKSIIASVPLNVLVMTINLFTGIAIFATYGSCDPIKLKLIKEPDSIIPYFVINELIFIPGMVGLFTSCIFSAVLSTLSSSISALVAVTYKDFLSQTETFSKMSDAKQANVSRLLGIMYGILSIMLAFVAKNLGPIFTAVLKLAGATQGPLGGIYLVGLFLPFVNGWGGIAGILSGIISMGGIATMAFFYKDDLPANNPLPTTVDNCPDSINGTLIAMANATIIESQNMISMPDLEYPIKILNLSYVLYPFVGTLVTCICGILVSAITGGFSKSQIKRVNSHLHPWLQKDVPVTDINLVMTKVPNNHMQNNNNNNNNSIHYSNHIEISKL